MFSLVNRGTAATDRFALSAVKDVHRFYKPAWFKDDHKQADCCRERNRAYIDDEQKQ